MLIDLHTHRLPSTVNGKCLLSLSLAEKKELSLLEKEDFPPYNIYISVGLHPWQVTSRWEDEYAEYLRKLSNGQKVVAIGETGLDKSRGGAWEYQMQAFEFQALLAEERNLPLIIHCVRAVQEIIAFKKQLKPAQPWIIHGFRGKPEQAQQLCKLGFYLSIGEHCSPETLRTIPPQALFLETDESAMPIEELYRRTALVRNVSMEELVRQIEANISLLSFSKML